MRCSLPKRSKKYVSIFVRMDLLTANCEFLQPKAKSLTRQSVNFDHMAHRPYSYV